MRFFATFLSLVSSETIIETDLFPTFIGRVSEGSQDRNSWNTVMIEFEIISQHRFDELRLDSAVDVSGCFGNSCDVDIEGIQTLDTSVYVSMGFGSAFLDHHRSVMIVPDFQRNDFGRIILSPLNPASLCDGPISYLPVTDDDIIASSIRLTVGDSAQVNTVTNAPVVFYNSQWQSVLPADWEDSVLGAIETEASENAAWDDSIGFYRFDRSSCHNGLLNRLPALTFIINDSVQLVMYPDSYMRESDCALMIYFNQIDAIGLGRSLHSKMAYILDADEQRVGFCDPI